MNYEKSKTQLLIEEIKSNQYVSNFMTDIIYREFDELLETLNEKMINLDLDKPKYVISEERTIWLSSEPYFKEEIFSLEISFNKKTRFLNKNEIIQGYKLNNRISLSLKFFRDRGLYFDIENSKLENSSFIKKRILDEENINFDLIFDFFKQFAEFDN